jgi:hypothetical protein
MRESVLVTDKWKGKLEELMLAFMNGEFDVLTQQLSKVGLMPNANTIFIIMPIILGCLICIKCEDVVEAIKKHFVISFVRLILP